MKIFLQLVSCFVALYAATLVDPSHMEWQEFKAKFDKNYKTAEEELFRKEIFLERRTLVAEHNAKHDRGEVTYKMGINKFSDMLYEEFAKIHTGLKYPGNPEIRTEETTFNFPEDVSVPDYVNWVEKGAVTPVKDQGDCGSCYAFSATGSMEGQHFLKTGKLVSLSEQNIVDCSYGLGNLGCDGGFVNTGFRYVMENNGIDTEESYPYVGVYDSCKFNNSTIGATVSSMRNLPSGDENALEKAVATIGPISVGVDSSNFTFYHSGIFTDSECSNYSLDHAVLIVGYGTDSKTQLPYWLVKNSWGEKWGEKGYIRIAKGAGNMCGIATEGSYPVL